MTTINSNAVTQAEPQDGRLKDVFASAVYYAQKGWSVLPIHSPRKGICSCGNRSCESASKHPRTTHGVRNASTDPVIIKGWWESWPDANVGIVTGMNSGLIALDVDPRHGGDETLANLESHHGKLPTTVEALTGGGGRHLLFSIPGLTSKADRSGKA